MEVEEQYILEKLSHEKGVITTKDATKEGISRARLSFLVQEDELDRVGHGMYALKDDLVDEYLLIQGKSEQLIYSYQTALYFHDLSDRIPSQIHITVPQGYNASRIKKRHNNLIIHYVSKNLLDLGREEAVSPFGNKIVLYVAERCLCDLLKDKSKIDSYIFTDAMKRYFSSKKINTRKLIKYARKLKVEPEMRNYIEVLT
ncbi:type IV toxin-antitoxin system AbiEi family antitoxin domain-containing protein [Dolosicoccus paucivorans]|uniref:type IV toxin-antitoxin system AbiEi family antitoxin domain-containing protein n=1 Tax=Dolosicoccus paucivorans TaxID=84521 RepID=UPI00087ECA4D|nr:type IV toxin-antitoxin system AbiEi family antitoxin domain-containing protein [Dolosicoccus paucivorans]SDI65291.1 Transcriptional regulator, AbiEi antitoxin, Type IV TA system [Dolosicoccus paucivorans]